MLNYDPSLGIKSTSGDERSHEYPCLGAASGAMLSVGAQRLLDPVLLCH